MCTFCSDMPSSEYGANHKKAPIAMFLKPNSAENESEKYRFRLLNFRSPAKNDRKFPFISRYVHNHWTMNERGNKVVDEYVVCPSSPYIDSRNDQTLGFQDTYKELDLKGKKPTWDNVCPMCRHVAEAWNSWKSSGKTDRLAVERAGEMKKQFQGIIPVYVINDPVNEKNNGRFKCLIISDQDEYKRFIDVVNNERAKISVNGNKYGWCNGTNAVDLYLRVDLVPVIWNEGKPNEKSGKVKKITKIAFGTTPYDLVYNNNGRQIITKEAIDQFEFDDQYYVKNSKTELEEFYKKFYSMVSSSIPSEEEDVFGDSGFQAVPQEKVQIPTNPSVPKMNGAQAEMVNDLMSDPDDLPYDDKASGDDNGHIEPSSQSVKELLDQLDFKD